LAKHNNTPKHLQFLSELATDSPSHQLVFHFLLDRRFDIHAFSLFYEIEFPLVAFQSLRVCDSEHIHYDLALDALLFSLVDKAVHHKIWWDEAL
jgi:hypothetical protein